MKRDRMLDLITRDDDVPLDLLAMLEAAELIGGPVRETTSELEVPAAGRDAWCGRCDGPREVGPDGCVACQEARS